MKHFLITFLLLLTTHLGASLPDAEDCLSFLIREGYQTQEGVNRFANLLSGWAVTVYSDVVAEIYYLCDDNCKESSEYIPAYERVPRDSLLKAKYHILCYGVLHLTNSNTLLGKELCATIALYMEDLLQEDINKYIEPYTIEELKAEFSKRTRAE